jgi:hypothetical protein
MTNRRTGKTGFIMILLLSDSISIDFASGNSSSDSTTVDFATGTSTGSFHSIMYVTGDSRSISFQCIRLVNTSKLTLFPNKRQAPCENVHKVRKMWSKVELSDVHHITLVLQHSSFVVIHVQIVRGGENGHDRRKSSCPRLAIHAITEKEVSYKLEERGGRKTHPES